MKNASKARQTVIFLLTLQLKKFSHGVGDVCLSVCPNVQIFEKKIASKARQTRVVLGRDAEKLECLSACVSHADNFSAISLKKGEKERVTEFWRKLGHQFEKARPPAFIPF